MASTYVNNLRLNEMATGDASGTWGTTTNTNLELIGEALGYGTEAITTNADTHTSTVADGASDAARAMYVKYTGTLDSACTITIAPNTMKRVQIIENATSGSQNIIISQGSGANVTIPTGRVAVVYLDGAGSGAAVVNAFTDLDLAGTLSIAGAVAAATDMTVGDDLTLSSDAAVLGFGADTDVTLTHVADTGLLLNSSRQLQFGDSGTYIHQSADGVLDLVADTEIEINATTIDINGNADVSGTVTATGTSVFASLDISGDIDVDGTTNLDVVDIDGAVDMASTLGVTGATTLGSNLSIPATSIFYLDGAANTYITEVSADNIQFVVGGAERFRIAPGAATVTGTLTATTADNTDTLTLISTDTDSAIGPNINLYRNAGNGADNDNLATIAFAGNDDGGSATDFYRITAQIEDASAGSEDVFVYHRTMVGGTERLRLSLESNETIINEGQTHAFFLDGGNNAAAFGTTPPSDSHTGWNQIFVGQKGSILSENATGTHGLDGMLISDNLYVDSDTGSFANIETNQSSLYMQEAGFHKFFSQASGSAGAAVTLAEKMRINASGDMGVGVSSPSTRLHIQDADYTTMSIQAGTTSHGAILNLGDSGDIDYGSITQFASSAGENGRMRFIAGTTETMNLAGGKVGIGTSSPTYELDVAGDIGVNEYIYHNDDTNTYMRFTADALTFRAGGDDRLSITTSNVTISGIDGQVTRTSAGGNGGAFLIRNLSSASGSYCRLYISPTSNDATDRGTIIQAENTDGNNNMAMVFKVSAGDSPAEVMRIVASKDLIIGGSSIGAAGALTIQPDEDDNSPVMTFNRASTTATSDPIRFKNGGSTVSQISYNNSTVTYGTGSDARYKNILGEAKGLEIVNKLNPVNFEWKDGGEIQDGLIAQEVEELIPHAINVNEEGYYSMDYSKVVTPLIKAIQEQQEQIDDLKSEINLLKGE